MTDEHAAPLSAEEIDAIRATWQTYYGAVAVKDPGASFGALVAFGANTGRLLATLDALRAERDAYRAVVADMVANAEYTDAFGDKYCRFDCGFTTYADHRRLVHGPNRPHADDCPVTRVLLAQQE
jgi:hypothetical protein